MSEYPVQLGELIPIKGIFYQVVDVVGQHQGTPEMVVLRPHGWTMGAIKRTHKKARRKK